MRLECLSAERGSVELRQRPGQDKPHYRVTRRGRTVHEKVIPVARARQARVLAALTRDERVGLYNTLKKLHAAFGTFAASTPDDGAFPG